MDKLLAATLNVVRERGEALFIEISKPYAYTLVAQFGPAKFLLKIARDAEDVSSSSLKDLKILGHKTNVASLCIVSSIKGQTLQRGIVYIRERVNFISLSTLMDYLDGEPPFLKLGRSGVVVEVDGEKLREYRSRLRLSLGELASELGVSRETIYRYERGKIEAPARVAHKLVTRFGVDVVKTINVGRPPEATEEELVSRRIGVGVYRLMESHPDALQVNDDVYLISTSAERRQKTIELAEALGVEAREQ